jgi:hypothetical protein
MLQIMSLSLQRPFVRRIAVAVFTCASAFFAVPAVAGDSTAPGARLHEVGRIDLPGVAGRIDHMAIDLEGQRLFVAALGADEVEVVDLREGRRVARLTGVREPQGVVYSRSLHRLFVAAGESGEVVAYEGEKRVGAVTGLPDADNLRLFAPSGRLVVGYGRGLAVIDPATITVVQRLPLPGHPEAFELAEHGPEIYVNVPDVGRVIVLDRISGKTTAEWSLDGGAANYPMAFDEPGHHLYVGTRRPARVVSYDASSGQLHQNVLACGDMDDLFFDLQRQHLIAVCGDGAIRVMQSGGQTLGEVQTMESASGARTGLFVPSTRLLYVAVPKGWANAAQVRIYRAE